MNFFFDGFLGFVDMQFSRRVAGRSLCAVAGLLAISACSGNSSAGMPTSSTAIPAAVNANARPAAQAVVAGAPPAALPATVVAQAADLLAPSEIASLTSGLTSDLSPSGDAAEAIGPDDAVTGTYRGTIEQYQNGQGRQAGLTMQLMRSGTSISGEGYGVAGGFSLEFTISATAVKYPNSVLLDDMVVAPPGGCAAYGYARKFYKKIYGIVVAQNCGAFGDESYSYVFKGRRVEK